MVKAALQVLFAVLSDVHKKSKIKSSIGGFIVGYLIFVDHFLLKNADAALEKYISSVVSVEDEDDRVELSHVLAMENFVLERQEETDFDAIEINADEVIKALSAVPEFAGVAFDEPLDTETDKEEVDASSHGSEDNDSCGKNSTNSSKTKTKAELPTNGKSEEKKETKKKNDITYSSLLKICVSSQKDDSKKRRCSRRQSATNSTARDEQEDAKIDGEQRFTIDDSDGDERLFSFEEVDSDFEQKVAEYVSEHFKKIN